MLPSRRKTTIGKTKDEQIHNISVSGDFICSCGKKVPFSMESDELDFPECEACGTEWQVSVAGDIADPDITITPENTPS